ncbi:BsuPI-related putative proteinase inhibitor [Deinococcus budaensis]|uniref:Intracellular proteinase inhibitor BsuPI domain-containing protein n=1 Tax=Deinococcus budaensis TaxID=1665626 RepID=A0A7W8LNY2_9DEIO|nr:BsuPI-related putative proteinase inhibitor [Deinococcus budaensis]MBB5233089.1 hypothetical protein [Deinococcus budaensis]
MPHRFRLSAALVLALAACAQAQTAPALQFRLEPEGYHAYQNGPPPPLTLTLTLRNPSTAPVTLTCRALGGPVLKRFTEFLNGESLLRDETVGELRPQAGAPVCRRVGERLTLAPRTSYTYARALGPQKVGAQVHYRSGWNVSAAAGSGWLRSGTVTALVVRGNRPIPTPNPQAYHDALDASRARWYSRSSRSSRPDTLLSFELADELSREAFLAELKKRGLNLGAIEIEVAPPARFPTKPTLAHSAAVTVAPEAQGYAFTLKVTNKTDGPLETYQSACDPLAIERVSDGLRVWQMGNGPCQTVGPLVTVLQPGESTTREARWDGQDSLGRRVPPGQYRVRLGLGQFVGEAVFTVK